MFSLPGPTFKFTFCGHGHIAVSDFCRTPDLRSEPARTIALLYRNGPFSVSAPLRSALYPHASKCWRKDNGSCSELCIPTPVVFTFFLPSLSLRLRGRSPIFRHPVHYHRLGGDGVYRPGGLGCCLLRVRIYSRVSETRLYPSSDDMSHGELGRLFRPFPSLLGPAQRL